MQDIVDPDLWVLFIETSEMRKLSILLPKYHDYLFQDITNLASDFFNIPVILMLREFNRYYTE